MFMKIRYLPLLTSFHKGILGSEEKPPEGPKIPMKASYRPLPVIPFHTALQKAKRLFVISLGRSLQKIILFP